MTTLRPLPFLFALVSGVLLGADSSPVDGPIPAVTPERFLPQVRDQLVAHLHLEGTLEIDLLRAWFPPTTPAAPWEMRVIVPPTTLASQNIVRVRLVSAEHNLGEWNLALRAQHWIEVLVAREPIERGAPLDPSLFDLRRVDVLREHNVVPAGTDLAQITVVRPVAAGGLLAWHDLARRPLVERGQQIEVVAAEGPLSITMKAQALQSGALGDTILVRNLQSRRDFPAVVSAVNQARVTF